MRYTIALMLGLLCFAQQAVAICFMDNVECIAGWYLEDYSQDTRSSTFYAILAILSHNLILYI